jgi:hypothetical protein
MGDMWNVKASSERRRRDRHNGSGMGFWATEKEGSTATDLNRIVSCAGHAYNMFLRFRVPSRASCCCLSADS